MPNSNNNNNKNNNSNYASSQHGHSDEDTGAGDYNANDRDTLTPTPTSINANHLDDYTLGMLSAPSTELSRRPSVAIGGVRSPNVKADEMAAIRDVSNNIAAYASNQRNNPNGPIPATYYGAGGGAGGGSGGGGEMSSGNGLSDNNSYFGTEDIDSSMQQQQQQQQQHHIASMQSQLERGRSSLRRAPLPNVRTGAAGGGVGNFVPDNCPVNPAFSFQQAMNDHFDHYKRAPSRDRSRDPSVDRFSRSSRQQSVTRNFGPPEPSSLSRGQSPAAGGGGVVGGGGGGGGGGGMRSMSRQRVPPTPPPPLAPSPSIRTDRSTPAPEFINRRPNIPLSVRISFLFFFLLFRNCIISIFMQHFLFQEMANFTPSSSVNGSVAGLAINQPAFMPFSNNQPTNSVEEMLLRQRLGQEIPHAGPNAPKRTESMYIAPSRKPQQVTIFSESNDN